MEFAAVGLMYEEQRLEGLERVQLWPTLFIDHFHVILLIHQRNPFYYQFRVWVCFLDLYAIFARTTVDQSFSNHAEGTLKYMYHKQKYSSDSFIVAIMVVLILSYLKEF